MTARAALLVLALVACSAGAAGAAVIEGRVTHPSKPNAGARLSVEAVGLDAQQNPITRETKSDGEGRFRFENLPAPAVYLVRVRWQGVTFPGGSAAFRPEDKDKPQTVDVKIYDSTTDASQLRIGSLQWIIARDAGVWRIQQAAAVRNPGSAVVIGAPDRAASVAIGVAADHGPVETFFGSGLPDGVAERDGTLEVRAPVFPGNEGFALQLEYDVERAGETLETEIVLPTAVENLAVYVEDFGVEVDAGQLHPARPARQDDQIYQAFIGFDLPAGTRLPLRVHVLPPATSVPQVLVALLAALGAGALLYFVIAPIVREALARSEPESLEPESPAKAALASALDDLDHDFETGKLSSEDRERLREDLRREALAALARERFTAGAAKAKAVPVTRSCSSCGRAAAAADRFCAGCGKAL